MVFCSFIDGAFDNAMIVKTRLAKMHIQCVHNYLSNVALEFYFTLLFYVLFVEKKRR